jgi:hypothetical protein
MAGLFLALGALAQLLSANLCPIIVLAACFKPLLTAIHDYQDNKFGRCANCLLICGVIAAGSELLFIKIPFGSEEQQSIVL